MTDSGDYQRAWQGTNGRKGVDRSLHPLFAGRPRRSHAEHEVLPHAETGNRVGTRLMAVTFYLGARINLWRCPRCGNLFSGTMWRSKGIFAIQCAHCGLGKYANGS